MVDEVIGFLDGSFLASECSSEVIKQNEKYSSYHSDTMINNIFAYLPGSWHDGSLATNVFLNIHGNIGCYKICVDQGSPRSGDAAGILVGLMKQACSLMQKLHPYLLKILNV